MAKKNNPISFFHNPRCRKSREALQLLEDAGASILIRYYLEDPPTSNELIALLARLNLSPMDLIRKEEALFKEQFRGQEHTDAEWIQIMVDHPKLIQRPIAIMGERAVVGRPPEQVLTLLRAK
ncbi:MAG: arsenate reductase (glutaredoxin) [Saprospiraceae bacterium]|nr:arsenate reductase (glutaredoxin) [Saprospiraceae bacterium]